MNFRAEEAADWVLALLTATVWCSAYALFFIRDAEARRRWRLFIWRVRSRLRSRHKGPRAVPAALAQRPAARSLAPPARRASSSALPTGRTATARKVEVAEPMRIAEWRVDNLPLRYRLLGRARRGANDN